MNFGYLVHQKRGKCMLKDFINVKRKILVIDYNNMIYRNLFTSFNNDPLDEEFKLWKYQMVNSIFLSLKTHEPDEVVIASDLGVSWRRSRIWEGYKANRAEGREASPVNFDKFFKVSNAFWDALKEVFKNWKWINIKGTEADDIIATITKNEPEKDIVCISADKDFQQLYKYSNFRQYNPIKRKFVECINPSIALQIKLLCGDSSDNIPSVKKRLGVKTAEKLINEGTIDILLSDPSIEKRYTLNKSLIDMDMIPQDIQTGIMEIYNANNSEFDGRAAFKCIYEVAPRMLDKAQEFFNMAKKCYKA